MRPRLLLVGLLLAGVGACAGAADNPGPIVSQPTTTVTTLPDQTALRPPAHAELVAATDADGFAEVEAALATAMERWESSGPVAYAYQLTIECDCPDQGVTWVRVFDRQLPEPPAWDVDVLFERISDTLARPPERIEVAFDAELGIPRWFATAGDDPQAILVDEFHEITRTASLFDGEWRFLGGEFMGREFGNPATGLIVFTLQHGSFGYPHDCNRAGGPVDIYGSHFGTEPALTFSTLVGCPAHSQEAELFAEALFASTTIEQKGSRLVLSGESSVLEFETLQGPDLRGELALTAAGETMTIDAAGGDLASVFTISSGTEENPARSIVYTLTATPTGSDQAPTWEQWTGEVEALPSQPGSVEVAIPDTISVGDYRLCSPYWSGDYYCYDLPVRPPSAPWYVTAGLEGVVLHDADGTSTTVWEQPARIAFWFPDVVVIEPQSGPLLALPSAGESVEIAPNGARLLDAARTDGSTRALMVRSGRTVLVDLDDGSETSVGDVAIEGRIAGDVVVLRTSPTAIVGRSSQDGSTMWELDVEPDEMVSSVDPTQMRLDSGRLNTDGSAMSFWQYLDTRIVDMSTGEVTEDLTRELAIPLEGDEVTEPCLRAELRDGLLLCPQADGRLTTIGVDDGNQQTVPGLTDTIATYVRSDG